MDKGGTIKQWLLSST